MIMPFAHNPPQKYGATSNYLEQFKDLKNADNVIIKHDNWGRQPKRRGLCDSGEPGGQARCHPGTGATGTAGRRSASGCRRSPAAEGGGAILLAGNPNSTQLLQ